MNFLDIVLVYRVDDLNENYQKGPRKNKLPERVGEFPQDASKVEAKGGRITMDCANVEDATRQGWIVFHMVFNWSICAPYSPRH